MTEMSLFSDQTTLATTTAPTGESGCDGLSSGQLFGLLDALVVGLDGLGGGRLEECLRIVGRCEARLAGVKADKVAELARWRGEDHAAAVLRGDLKQSRGGAKREVKFAERLGALPKTAKALAAGNVTPQAARTIADAAAHTPVDEAELLTAAEKEPADVFARTVRDHVNERTAAEDLEEQRRRQRARREANIKQESDGMYKLFGTFDPVAGARIETASVAQRVALAIRDRGCVVCGAANSYCQAHHVIHWEDGGPTDIDNLCLLCSHCHHKLIHELGADLTRQPDGTYRLEHPPNFAGLTSHSGNTRNGKARTAKAHPGKRGRPGRRNGTTATNEANRTANHPLQC